MGPKPFRWFLVALLIPVCLAAGMRPPRAQAAVTLVDFTAELQDGGVLIQWETATEVDNVGFYVNRRDLLNDPVRQRISPFIPTQGDTFFGAVYDYLDTTVEQGTVYEYRLESIDINSFSEFSDPVIVSTGGVLPTNTPTLTPSPTVEPTPTFTPSPTSPPSHTPQPAQTRTPSPTISLTPSATPKPGATASATLKPSTEPSATSTLTTVEAADTPTPTRTPRPTRTTTPWPPTWTAISPSRTASHPVATATLAASPTPSPTATPDASQVTDLPYPAVEATRLRTAAPGATIQPDPGPVASASIAKSHPWDQRQGKTPAARQPRNLRARVLPLVLIVWSGLGAWFYLSLRPLRSRP